jgi:hypothetical protein
MCISVHVENRKVVMVPEAHYIQFSPILYSSGEWDATVKNGANPLTTGPIVTVDSRTSRQ